MTTGYDVLDSTSTANKIIRQGAGHVDPMAATDPGLVFDAGWADWLGFLCGTQLPSSYCTTRGIPVIAPSNFNSPSIAISALAGSATVIRTVTNVGAKGTYNVSVTGLAGFNVTVTPSTFTLNPGQKQTLQNKITRTTATLNAYTGGYLTWKDATHTVRIPVVAQPVALAAPVQVCHEIIDQALRFANGFHLDDMHVRLEEIHKVGAGKSYVSAPTTLKKYKTGYYVNPIFPRWSMEKWMDAGQPHVQDKLREYTMALVNDLPAPEDHEEMMRKGEEFIKGYFS